MTDSSLLSILHISDFHYRQNRAREQTPVVEALVLDLETLCVGHRKPDLVMFTGDLVHAAGIDRHEDAYDFLLDKVSKVTGCSDERIFIAAGNHDLSWTGLEKFAEETHKWRALLGTPEETSTLNHLYEKRTFDGAVSEKFTNYNELEQYLAAGSNSGRVRRLSNSFVVVDHIEALNLDVVTFNTAVLSAGGHKGFESDERKLAVPEYAVMDAVKVLKDGSFRIFVTHHPLSWLSEQSSKILEGEIAKSGHLHLFGHMHDPQPKNIVGLRGEVLADQAGAIFTARKEYYNGYSLLTFDRGAGYAETLVRSYMKERNEFDAGTDIIKEGRWWPSNDAKQHFRKIAAPVDERLFRIHLCGRALNALLTREEASPGDGDTHEKFIAPPLRRRFIQEVKGDDSKVQTETALLFSDIVAGDSNHIIYARAEYGRTTLLRELRYRLLVDANEIRFPRLPVLIDFKEVATNTDNLLRKVKGGSEETPEENDIESLLKLGHACVMVDDVLFDDTRRMRILRDFVARFPKARYIFSSPQHSASKMGAFIDPEMPVRFEFVEVLELSRNDMRQLLKKDERCTDVEDWLDRLQSEFREINLPFTAANGSILIEILSEKYNFTPINRSVLMEQFVDSTLRKAAIEQSKRETFDYTNKTSLLSHIAAWMAKNDDYVPAKEILRREMGAYIDNIGLNASLDDLLAEFLSARIFIAKSDERISFRYRGVLEYFIALKMTTDNTFKDWVLEEDRYLRYVNEIQYYAGKLRSDLKLVELIANRHINIEADLLEGYDTLDLHQFDTIALPVEEEDSVSVLEREIASPPLNQEEKDTELQTEIPKDAEDRQEVFRPKSNESSDRFLLSLLLYSGLIKNMEMIPDAEKRKHLAAIWRGWSILLIASLRVAPRLAKERRIRINGALYEVLAPHGMSDTSLLRRIMLFLPHVHIKLLSGALGTEKLDRQLSEPTLSEASEPKIYDFLRTGLIADLRLSSTPGAVQALTTKLKENKYLLWSFIVHVSELRRLDRVRKEHFVKLEKPLAEAFASLRGGTKEARLKETNRQHARLTRERLMLTMKKNREDEK